MPPGEREYLMRLRCPGGDEPEFERVGSFGRGPNGTIIDGYDVRCKDGSKSMVFMDMYHRGYREKSAVPGFTVLADLPAYVAKGCIRRRCRATPRAATYSRPMEIRVGPEPLTDIRAKEMQSRQAGPRLRLSSS